MIVTSLAVELGGGTDPALELGAGAPGVAVCAGAMIVTSLAVELGGGTDAALGLGAGSPGAAVCAVAMIVASLAVELSVGTPPLDGAPLSAPAEGSVGRRGSTSVSRSWVPDPVWICPLV
jgi:hypothetical protein